MMYCSLTLTHEYSGLSLQGPSNFTPPPSYLVNGSPDSSKLYDCELFIEECTFYKTFLFFVYFYLYSIFRGCQGGGTGNYDPKYRGLKNINLFQDIICRHSDFY